MIWTSNSQDLNSVYQSEIKKNLMWYMYTGKVLYFYCKIIYAIKIVKTDQQEIKWKRSHSPTWVFLVPVVPRVRALTTDCPVLVWTIRTVWHSITSPPDVDTLATATLEVSIGTSWTNCQNKINGNENKYLQEYSFDIFHGVWNQQSWIN